MHTVLWTSSTKNSKFYLSGSLAMWALFQCFGKRYFSPGCDTNSLLFNKEIKRYLFFTGQEGANVSKIDTCPINTLIIFKRQLFTVPPYKPLKLLVPLSRSTYIQVAWILTWEFSFLLGWVIISVLGFLRVFFFFFVLSYNAFQISNVFKCSWKLPD